LRYSSVFARRFALGRALKFFAHPLLEGRHVLATAEEILDRFAGIDPPGSSTSHR
jgi:hypothetical protein